MKILVKEEPYKEPLEVEWNVETMQIFTVDEVEDLLENNKIVWHGGTAYSIEEQDDIS